MEKINWVLKNWISVKDALPEIPEGKYSISVIVAVYDPVFAEGKADPRSGYDVYQVIFKDGQFVDIITANGEFYPISDEVTHWMYMPEPPIYEG